MSHPPTTRRRGGQPGNLNRLRHGLYSSRFALPNPQSDPELRSTIIRKRLREILKKQQSATVREWISFERAISAYISLLISLQSAGCQVASSQEDESGFAPAAWSLGFPGTAAIPQSAAGPIRTSMDLAHPAAGLPVESPIRTVFRFWRLASLLKRQRSDDEPHE